MRAFSLLFVFFRSFWPNPSVDLVEQSFFADPFLLAIMALRSADSIPSKYPSCVADFLRLCFRRWLWLFEGFCGAVSVCSNCWVLLFGFQACPLHAIASIRAWASVPPFGMLFAIFRSSSGREEWLSLAFSSFLGSPTEACCGPRLQSFLSHF